ncbi:hypothetical protein GE061_006368 [Apolygus lucorum]|uniref:Protein adenylyltransferase Fic n=1 Tax=Apolygus lucorum TaxID=248454 RepID=A0A6A4JDB9_APOLU|nr:hypothetical protein GE061_006368 [Apolygus lucorum]
MISTFVTNTSLLTGILAVMVYLATLKLFDPERQSRALKGDFSHAVRVFNMLPEERDLQEHHEVAPAPSETFVSQKVESEKVSDSEALSSLQFAEEMMNLGKFDKVRKLLEHAVALSPKNPDVLNRYGEFLEFCAKDIVKADHLYLKALTRSPGHHAATRNRGRVAAVVEEMDMSTLHRIDQKRDIVASIPESNPALKKAKREAYYQHIYHTVGIEGNTMTLSQTRSILETRIAIGGKSIAEHNEILGLDAALKYINSSLVNRIGRISIQDILELHKKVLGYVDPTEGGSFRRTQVFVGDHIPPAPSNILPLMNQFESWLNDWKSSRLHPVRYAAIAHYKLVHIHPFHDGNGRTARLLMNMILMNAGFPPVIILKQDRQKYYQMLVTANEGDIRPFVRFIAECTERTLDMFLWSTSEYSSEIPAILSDKENSNPSTSIRAIDEIPDAN